MVRTPNINSVDYHPSPPPIDQKEVVQYAYDEFIKISASFRLLADGHIDQTNAAPIKPRNGDIRLADGTDWNPGLGQGVYCYYNSTWNKLG